MRVSGRLVRESAGGWESRGRIWEGDRAGEYGWERGRDDNGGKRGGR